MKVKLYCKGVSTVDYGVAMHEVFSIVHNFKICYFNPLLSDMHCAVELTVQNIIQKMIRHQMRTETPVRQSHADGM